MAVKRAYSRYFIIFQEEDRGFEISIDKQPTGYVKIESKNGKCKITVYVQNLKHERGPYIFYMLDGSKNPPVIARLGNIAIDETGRGETWWEFKDEDIGDTGVPVDRFNVAAVVLEGERIIAPLAGYIGKDKFEWKDKIMLRSSVEEEVEEEVEEKVEEELKREEIVEDEIFDQPDEEAIKFKEYEENIRLQEEASEPEIIDQKDEEYSEADEKDEDFSRDNEYNDEIEDVTEGTQQPFMYDYSPEDYRDGKKKTHASLFHDILKNFDEVSSDMKGCKWWKIPHGYDIKVDSNKHYPYFCAVYHLKMTYPYLNYIKYFKRKGGYYFGIRYNPSGEVKYIMYGIEGQNHVSEQPYMGMTGFTKWDRLNKNIGIWMMYYNPYTGCIMVPKKKDNR